MTKPSPEISYRHEELGEFIGKLASTSPAPGGGGAAALLSALGLALCAMAEGLSMKKLQETEVSLHKTVLCKLNSMIKVLIDMIDEDEKNFLPLSKAYSLPKETIEEQKKRDFALQEALKTALIVPIKTMDICLEASELTQISMKTCSKLVLSDAGCAAMAIRAGAQAAWLNIIINTKLLKDKAQKDRINSKYKKILANIIHITDAIYEQVEADLC